MGIAVHIAGGPGPLWNGVIWSPINLSCRGLRLSPECV